MCTSISNVYLTIICEHKDEPGFVFAESNRACLESLLQLNSYHGKRTLHITDVPKVQVKVNIQLEILTSYSESQQLMPRCHKTLEQSLVQTNPKPN